LEAPAPFDPIGHVRTGPNIKFESPRQPESDSAEVNRIELLPGQNFELALQDLAGFDRIWLLWWFDRNQNWRPRVIPPRGPAVRRGVFATRSPHRPNPIGLTCVQLLSVEGLTLEVGPLDLLDGTPIFDIKPYIPDVDSFPDSATGWLEEVNALETQPAPYKITTTPRAESELQWLKENFGIDLAQRALPILERDPSPHRTRRILKLTEGRFRMACGVWRPFFRLEGNAVVIEEIGKGYDDQMLMGNKPIQHRDAQIAFSAWISTLE